jgi:hypothetical protein
MESFVLAHDGCDFAVTAVTKLGNGYGMAAVV